MGATISFAQSSDPVFRADTRLVLLHASVVDRRGNLVTDLDQSAFTVLEEKQEQPLRLFRREDIPVSMGLIVDNSGSMRDKRKQVEAAVVALVGSSTRDDEVFVVNFNDDLYLDVTMTNDRKKLEEGIGQLDSRGGTAMRDAISAAIDYMREKSRKDKKVLLVVTDGNDNASAITLEKLVQRAQQSEVLVYSIGLLNEEERREAKRAERALEALTKATGGQAYFPGAVADVDEVAKQVAHDIRNQYVLGYTPTNEALDGGFRRIEVRAKGRGLTVRTRTGYYASPKGQDLPGSPDSPSLTPTTTPGQPGSASFKK
ncbi:MAG: VWA domain-containing protein [Bryobacterales bacterium]|nr:VWA domain-containing protein [Bryobacterales bacterium]